MNVAFVLGADDLRRLSVLLSEMGRAQIYTVAFADGTSIRFADVNEVIQQDNVPENPIVSLIAEGEEGSPRSVYVVLRKTPQPSIEYTITGAQKEVVYASQKLDHWVSRIRQWHSIARTQLGGFVVLFGCFLAPFLVWTYIHAHYLPTVSDKGPWQGTFIVCLWIIEGFSTRLFPAGVFAIGHGAKRYDRLKAFRNAMLYGIPSAIVAGVLGTWLYEHYR